MSDKKKEKKEVTTIANIGGVEVPLQSTISEVKKGTAIRSFVPSDAVDAYFKAQGVDKDTRAKYEDAKNALLVGIRGAMTAVFEQNPTTVPVTARIGNTGNMIVMTPEKSVRESVAKDAKMVSIYGGWKVTTKVVAPEFAKTSDSSKELAARIKAALGK